MDVPQILTGLSLLALITVLLSTKAYRKWDAQSAFLGLALYFLLINAFPIGLRFPAIGVGVIATLVLMARVGYLRPLRWMISTGLATMALLTALEFFYPIQDKAIRNTLLALTAISAIGFVVSAVWSVVKEAKYHLANR